MITKAPNTYTKYFQSMIGYIEIIGLTIIALGTIYTASMDVFDMWTIKIVTLGDILMMFIYLEILAMTGVYLQSGKLPIRIPIYIAIVALARYLIIEVKELTTIEMISIAAGILMLSITVLIMRYGQSRYPYVNHNDLHNGSDSDSKNKQ